ncbi:hypothetical protein [Burkholderia pseudomallei]|uniref:hypothetical protein n=1 Tax=Burkholderia pseudomallei TaxID=28450 RepID=UPI002930D97F|nr:hypothetical protein [Burkholderia pseudomallei]
MPLPSVIHCRARPVRSIVALSSHGMLRYRFAALPLCRFAALPRRFACAADCLTPARAARERASPDARP